MAANDIPLLMFSISFYMKHFIGYFLMIDITIEKRTKTT